MVDQDYMLRLPSMGEGVSEASIVRWLRKVGDKITKEDPIIEISTDKVDTEIVSPFSGYLIATFVDKGEIVRVGQTLAQLSSYKEAEVKQTIIQKVSVSSNASGQSRSSLEPHVEGKKVAKSIAYSQKETTASFSGDAKASPLVRKIAREYGLDLHRVSGSGLYGRITRDDVLCFLEESSERHQDDDSSSLKTEKKDGNEYVEGVLVERKPMSRVRELTAKHMLHSIRVSPHVTTTFEVCLRRVCEFKKNYTKTKLTFTVFFIQAVVAALKKHPIVNVSVDGCDILYKKDVNIGCAVATDSGLIVPVLKRAQNLATIDVLALELQKLIEKSHQNKLLPSDIVGGTFSITNLGMYGSIHSQPIINQPQVAIMSIGTIVDRCVVVQGKVEIMPICHIGLTFDHRVIDGHEGALFLKSIKDYLESYEVKGK